MRKESFQGILLGIVIMCAVFAFITVAWAALSTTLTVNGTASIAAQSWKIGFGTSTDTTVLSSNSTVSCTATTGATCPESANYPVLTANSFGKTTGESPATQSLGSFNAPGGSLTYTWRIINEGTFDAYVNTITGVDNSGNVTLTCTSDDNGDTSEVLAAFCSKITGTFKINTAAPGLNVSIAKKSGGTATYVPVELVLTYVGNFESNQTLPTGNVTVKLNGDTGISVIYGQDTTSTAAVGG